MTCSYVIDKTLKVDNNCILMKFLAECLSNIKKKMIFLAHMKRMFKWAFLTTCFPSVCLSFQLSTFHKFFSNLLHQKWPNLHQSLYILYMWPRTNNWVPTGVQSYHWNIWRKSFEIFFSRTTLLQFISLLCKHPQMVHNKFIKPWPRADFVVPRLRIKV